MNNSVFGKTMENIRNRIDVNLISEESQAKKITTESNCKCRTMNVT